MAGVVRRDGLREAVSLRARLERERDVLERLAHHPCPCPRDTPVPEVAAVDAIIDHLARVLDAVPDVPPTESPTETRESNGASEADWREANRYYEDDPGLLHDVPPDPPAADLADLRVRLRDAIGDGFSRWLFDDTITGPGGDLDRATAAVIDVLRESGVLVDAADVRARHAEQLARDILREGGEDFRYAATWLRDRAVSEREGTTS